LKKRTRIEGRNPKTERMISMDKRMDRSLDVTQVAKRLSVSRSTVYRLIEQGDLPASRLGTAHCIRINESDVAAFMEMKNQEI
jgi:excisionase family DNA binding protein